MLNKSIIMGRLTADPELRTTASDVSVCSFTVAVDRRYKKDGEDRLTDFIKVVAWRNTAEFICKHFNKGKMINVVGSIQTRSYEDAEGKKHYVTEVIAEEVNFCGDNKRSEQADDCFQSEGFTAVGADDDLPF